MNTYQDIQLSKAHMVFPELVPQQQARPARPIPVTSRERSRPTTSDGQLRATMLSMENMHCFGDLFVDYLKARRETFIVQKGWHLPEVDGMEFDQYDTPRARWIVIHEYGEVLAGIRIAPTKAQCGLHSYMIRDAQLGMLSSLPDNILYFEAPVADHIWEATRLFVAPSVPAQRRAGIQQLLMIEMARSARRVGATHVIGIVPAVFKRWMKRIGMNATAVGPVIELDGDRSQAALMNVEELTSRPDTAERCK